MAAKKEYGITWLEASQRYQLRVFDRDRCVYRAYFPKRRFGSKTEALQAARDARDEQRGRLIRGEPVVQGAVTVDDLLDQYLASKKHLQNPGELATRAGHVRGLLGWIEIRKLTDGDVSAAQAALQQTYSPKYVRHIMMCLRGATRKAVQMGLVRTNVALAVDLPELQPKPERYTPTEIERLLTAASGSWLHPAVGLLADCALRPGELCALKWDDIDPESRMLRIRRSRKTLERCKTKHSIRDLPLTTRTWQALMAWQSRRRGEYIFPALDGSLKPLTVQTFDEQFANLLGKTGLRRRRPYDMRHTAITMAVTFATRVPAPLNLRDVAVWAGHAPNARTT